MFGKTRKTARQDNTRQQLCLAGPYLVFRAAMLKSKSIIVRILFFLISVRTDELTESPDFRPSDAKNHGR